MGQGETCSYGSCDRPAEVTIRWRDTEEEYTYCAHHARTAREEYPDLVEVLD